MQSAVTSIFPSKPKVGYYRDKIILLRLLEQLAV